MPDRKQFHAAFLCHQFDFHMTRSTSYDYTGRTTTIKRDIKFTATGVSIVCNSSDRNAENLCLQITALAHPAFYSMGARGVFTLVQPQRQPSVNLNPLHLVRMLEIRYVTRSNVSFHSPLKQ